jgi:hypothetical protein
MVAGVKRGWNVMTGVKQMQEGTRKDPMMVAPSPFEEAQSELALVPVNGGGNGDGENQKAFGCSVEGQKNREWVSVEFWKMWAK